MGRCDCSASVSFAPLVLKRASVARGSPAAVVDSSSVASSFQPFQVVGRVADKRGASTKGNTAQVAEVPAPTTALAADEAEKGEIPLRRSPKGGKGLPSSSLGTRQTATQPLSALPSHHVQAPRRTKLRQCRLPRLRLLMKASPHRKGAITAYLAPKAASSVTEATRSSGSSGHYPSSSRNKWPSMRSSNDRLSICLCSCAQPGRGIDLPRLPR